MVLLESEGAHEEDVVLSWKSEELDVVGARQEEISIKGMGGRRVKIDCPGRTWQVAGREVAIWLPDF
jgi:cell wall-associated NlpC family hydrolase